MRKVTYQQLLGNAEGEAPPRSTLTINHPGAAVGLMNLLDVVEHRIEADAGQTIHWLTFCSGQSLRIVSGEHSVTVDGERISYHPSEIYPFNTLLSDPA